MNIRECYFISVYILYSLYLQFQKGELFLPGKRQSTSSVLMRLLKTLTGVQFTVQFLFWGDLVILLNTKETSLQTLNLNLLYPKPLKCLKTFATKVHLISFYVLGYMKVRIMKKTGQLFSTATSCQHVNPARV